MPGKNYEIKTTLSLDGEQKFKQAIEDANRSMKVMDSEMRKAKAAYQAGGDGVDYYNAKAEAMSGKVKQQEAIVKALEQAVEESAKAYGEASKQADTYRIKLNQAEATLIKMRKASKDADKEAEELGRDAKKVGKQIKDGLGDSADEAAEKMDGGFAKIKNSIDEIRGSMQFQMVTQIGGAVIDGIQQVMSFVEENNELNTRIAMTRANLERYGLSWDEVQDVVVRATAFTNEQDGAMEAVSHLAQAGITSNEMMEAAMMDLLGVYLMTGGALSLESLSESLRESVVSRAPTGAYAEALEGVLGEVALETVQQALEGAETQEEALQIALSYLTQAGAQTYARDFEQENEQLTEYTRRSTELTFAWADLASSLTPTVTSFVDGMISFVDMLTTVVDALVAFDERFPWVFNILGGGLTSTVSGGAINTTGFNLAELAQEPNERRGFWEWLFPSAGAEEMPEGWAGYAANAPAQVEDEGWAEYAANARTQIETELANGTDAAHNAGTQLIADFGAGIDAGSAEVVNNVSNMVNQINSLLGSVSGAYGFGLAGAGGVSLVVDGQELGRAVAHGVSTTIGNRVATRMYAD